MDKPFDLNGMLSFSEVLASFLVDSVFDLIEPNRIESLTACENVAFWEAAAQRVLDVMRGHGIYG